MPIQTWDMKPFFPTLISSTYAIRWNLKNSLPSVNHQLHVYMLFLTMHLLLMAIIWYMPTVKEQKNNLFIISVIDLCISYQVVFHYEINRSFAVTQTKCKCVRKIYWKRKLFCCVIKWIKQRKIEQINKRTKKVHYN